MARDVQQQQVVPVTVGEEVLDGQVEQMRRLVQQRLYLEAADGRVREYAREPFGVLGGCPEPPQVTVLVVRARDDQRGGGASLRRGSVLSSASNICWTRRGTRAPRM